MDTSCDRDSSPGGGPIHAERLSNPYETPHDLRDCEKVSSRRNTQSRLATTTARDLRHALWELHQR